MYRTPEASASRRREGIEKRTRRLRGDEPRVYMGVKEKIKCRQQFTVKNSIFSEKNREKVTSCFLVPVLFRECYMYETHAV